MQLVDNIQTYTNTQSWSMSADADRPVSEATVKRCQRSLLCQSFHSTGRNQRVLLSGVKHTNYVYQIIRPKFLAFKPYSLNIVY